MLCNQILGTHCLGTQSLGTHILRTRIWVPKIWDHRRGLRGLLCLDGVGDAVGGLLLEARVDVRGPEGHNDL